MHQVRNKKQVLRGLEGIPGVGESIARDLWNLGIRSPYDLKNRDPQMLYEKHCKQKGKTVDRCVLYVFRCAVYFASHKRHNPKLLLWWNWKDG